MNIYDLIDQKELLEFSRRYDVDRNRMGNTLFPDRKTQSPKVEIYDLCENGNLPTLANVHAYDAEAEIAERIPFENIKVESFLIKRKINQSEKLQMLLDAGVTAPESLVDRVFNDAKNLAENVIAQTEHAKMQLLATGKVSLKGNGVNISIDYGVPNEFKVSADWSNPDADIMGDLRKWRKLMRSKGRTPNAAVTSDEVVEKMLANKGIQTAIYGANGVGTLPSVEQLNNLFRTHVGITVTTNDEMYSIEKVSGGKVSFGNARFFPEDGFAMFVAGQSGAIGAGVWGVTPDERATEVPWKRRTDQFVTISQWKWPDPMAVWTKASGLFVPAIADSKGLLCATIKLESA